MEFVLLSFFYWYGLPPALHSFPTRRSSDLPRQQHHLGHVARRYFRMGEKLREQHRLGRQHRKYRSEEHTSELQSRQYLVCRLLLEKKKSTECRQRFGVNRRRLMPLEPARRA